VVEGKQDATKLLRGRPKPLLSSRARLKPRVAFNNEASETATLIEIVAEDRPGLLYDLARAITEEGCNIEVVLIDTEAHKALDVFYVSKIAGAIEGRLKKALIAACIGS
jgi:[protein-PII] uridylyltransferase